MNENHAKMNIITTGRTDIESYFRLSGVLESQQLAHTPFIVFNSDGANVSVEIVRSVQDLLTYSEDTKVMGQWGGKYRIDFFQFTIKDVKKFLDKEKSNNERV